MATRRERLRKAEKLLRQGRLEAAITEYVVLIEEEPKDWATTNALGDLYVRANQVDQAVGQYTRIADHFSNEGFYPKAAALYKKILKVKPTDEPSQMRLGNISAQQGKLVDARAAFTALIQLRLKRGDTKGANEIVVRLGELDPKDLSARRAGAQALIELGQVPEAIETLGTLATDLSERGQTDDAIGVMRSVLELDPANVATRGMLARMYLATGNLEAAREYLTEEVAGDDPAMLLAVAELKLRGGETDEGREVIRRVIGLSPDASEQVLALAASLSDKDADAAFVCIDQLADVAIAAEDWDGASTLLQEFAARVPQHVGALVKLVEVCVDGSLDDAMVAAQTSLADAFLAIGKSSEASVIAEDLVVRDPSNEAHVERYRRALAALGDPDPDARIADRVKAASLALAGGDGLDELGDDFFDEPEAVTPAETPAPNEISARAAPAPAVGEPPPPVDAAGAAEQPAQAAGGHGAVDLNVSRLDLTSLFADEFAPAAPPGAAPPTAEAAPTSGSMEIDLTSVLGDLEPGNAASQMPAPTAPPAGPLPAPSLDEVFDQFRDENSEAPAEETAAQQYQLGLSYRKMGKLDEAIAALETAARSPRQRFNSSVMLGRLYFDKREPARALDWLERAAEASAPSDEDHRALLYHLGVTLERLGETSRALAVFMELQADAGDYRDVSQRVGRLSRVQTGG